MITIRDGGYDKFTNICKKCGCVFEYELNDLKKRVEDDALFVECPKCSYRGDHLDNVRIMKEVDSVIDSIHRG